MGGLGLLPMVRDFTGLGGGTGLRVSVPPRSEVVALSVLDRLEPWERVSSASGGLDSPSVNAASWFKEWWEWEREWVEPFVVRDSMLPVLSLRVSSESENLKSSPGSGDRPKCLLSPFAWSM